MQFLQSSNAQISFPAGLAQRRLTGVVYSGPSKRGAVVVWSAELIEKGGAIVISGGLLLRKGGTVAAEVSPTLSVIPRAVGSVGGFGGCLVLDLEPGDVLELLGFADDVTSFDLKQDGLKIVIL